MMDASGKALNTRQGSSTKKTKTLIIHIGDHKTGTTTLQNALAGGCFTIKGAKLLYPAKLNHNYLSGYVRAWQQGRPVPQVLRQNPSPKELADQISVSSADYVVLSGEVFENISAPVFHEMVERHFRGVVDRVRVLAYVRPHASRLLSSFGEQIKIGWFRDDMQAFFENNRQSGRFHYAPRFKQWQDVFGEDFCLRPMIRTELKDRSVLEDFAEVAFDGLPCHIRDLPSENQALDLRGLMFVKHAHTAFLDRNQWLRHTLGWELARRLSQHKETRQGERLQMDVALARQMAETYAADAAEMDRTFFGGRALLSEALASAPDKAIEVAQSVDPADHFTPEELRNITVLAEVIADMLNVKHKWPAHFHRHRILDVQAQSAT